MTPPRKVGRGRSVDFPEDIIPDQHAFCTSFDGARRNSCPACDSPLPEDLERYELAPGRYYCARCGWETWDTGRSSVAIRQKEITKDSPATQAGLLQKEGDKMHNPDDILHSWSALLSRVPHSLKSLRQWVFWRHEMRDGKPTKVPYYFSGGRWAKAATNKPEQWRALEEMLIACEKGGGRRIEGFKDTGVGFVLAAGSGIVGIDLDWKEWAGEGSVPPEAQAIVDKLRSYTEWSPSFKGCHILLRGGLPAWAGNRKQLAPGVHFEAYDRSRFLTVTGRRWAGYPEELEGRQTELEDLLRELFPPSQARQQHRHVGEAPSTELGDADLLEQMFASPQGEKIRRLWEGDTSEYPSHSEADLALCGHLMWWTGNNREQADRLFRQSKLFRAKWDEKHASGGRTYGEITLERAVASNPRGHPGAPEDHHRDEPSTKGFIEQVCRDCELWEDEEEEAWATVPAEGHKENWPVDSQQFRKYLLRQWYRTFGKPLHDQTLRGILAHIEAEAADRAKHHTHRRVGHADGVIWFDLGQPDWQAAKITPEDWTLTGPEIRFRRSKAAGVLPTPLKWGSEALREYLAPWELEESSYVLIIAWLLYTLSPGPYAILVITGEQGSGKTTLTRALQQLVDPSLEISQLPPSPRDLLVMARNNHVLAFDNVASLPAWFSNALCVVATGGMLQLRKLYTDNKEIYLRAKNPVILNGISDFVTQQDLLSRTVRVQLPVLGQYTSDRQLQDHLDKIRPRALGALLNLTSLALRNLPHTPVPNTRLVDFAHWGKAAESGYTREGGFEEAFFEMLEDTIRGTLDSDPVYPVLVRLLEKSGRFTGGAGDLLKQLDGLQGDMRVPRDWPSNPRAMGKWLKYNAPALRKVGIRVELLPRKNNKRLWIVEKSN